MDVEYRKIDETYYKIVPERPTRIEKFEELAELDKKIAQYQSYITQLQAKKTELLGLDLG